MVTVDPRTQHIAGSWLATYRSTNTRAAYERDLADFVSWCDGAGHEPLQTCAEQLGAYRDASLAAGASAATVTRRLSGLASFFRHAAAHGAVTTNPADDVERPAPRAARSRADTLDDGELNDLFDAAGGLSPKAAALVGLLGFEGMRLDDALAINVPQVRVGARPVTIEITRQQRRLRLTDTTAAAVERYVEGRRKGPLFLGDSAVARSSTRLTRFGADFLLKRAGASAQIGKTVSATVLRRSYVESERRAGTPLDQISEHIGHREVRETSRLLNDDG
jgi:site-specific recombinase XerD